MTKDTQPTSGNAWRLSNTALHTFKTGRTAKLKRVSLLSLARAGKLPDFLSGAVISSTNGGGQNPFKQIDPGQLPEMDKALEIVCREIFVEPLIVEENPGEAEILFSDLTDSEKGEAISWAMGTDGASAATFPERQRAGVPVVSDQLQISDAPIDGDGNKK